MILARFAIYFVLGPHDLFVPLLQFRVFSAENNVSFIPQVPGDAVLGSNIGLGATMTASRRCCSIAVSGVRGWERRRW